MVILTIAIVMAIIAVSLFAYSFVALDEDSRGLSRLFSGGVALLTAIVLAFSMVYTIQPREVGVKVAFGKTQGSVDSGLHIKAPWTSIKKYDGSIQNDVFNGEDQITVRLGNSSQAKADASIRWQLKVDNAESLYADYKTFDNIRDNLVERNFQAAMNSAFAEYNPLADVQSADNNNGDALSKIAAQVKETLQAKVGNHVDIHDVTIPILNYDESTQRKIDELQSEVARTRTAEQKQKTSEAEKRANEILEGSLSTDVLTSKCLDIADRNGKDILGCIPGTTGQPVINR